jgi:hypothetical protein
MGRAKPAASGLELKAALQSSQEELTSRNEGLSRMCFIFYFAINNEILSPTISRLARLRLWRTDDPVAAQREVLQHLITSAQYTEFGRKPDFRTFSVKQFEECPFMNTRISRATSTA